MGVKPTDMEGQPHLSKSGKFICLEVLTECLPWVRYTALGAHERKDTGPRVFSQIHRLFGVRVPNQVLTVLS